MINVLSPAYFEYLLTWAWNASIVLWRVPRSVPQKGFVKDDTRHMSIEKCWATRIFNLFALKSL